MIKIDFIFRILKRNKRLDFKMIKFGCFLIYYMIIVSF